MRIYHNTRLSDCREPFGAVAAGTTVKLRAVLVEDVDNNIDGDIRDVDDLSALKHLPLVEPMHITVRYENGRDTEVITLNTDMDGFVEYALERVGLYFYRYTYGGIAEEYEHQITVYDGSLSVPEWFRHGMVYQIFPDRFALSDNKEVVHKRNSFIYGDVSDIPMYIRDELGDIVRWDFYGGSLWGVAEQLDYIQNMGATAVYLNPIFEAVSNHRYDTADYMHVDGMLGGDKAFENMVGKMHARGIKVILDGVFNHTGAQSKYFDINNEYSESLDECDKGAYLSVNSRYRPWFNIRDDGSYECWWDIEALPNVNELDETYTDFIISSQDSVVKHWTRRGVDGWRLDVADELPDEFIKKLRSAVTEVNSDGVIFGEVWEDASNKISYDKRRMYFTEPELHSVTNYPFRNTLVSFLDGEMTSSEISRFFTTMKENYPRHNFYAQLNMTGSHDVTRLYTVMKDIAKGDDCAARGLVKAYSMAQFTYVGVPLVYYGDETCVEGYEDPDNRRFFPWKSLDSDMVAWFSSLARLRAGDSVLLDGDVRFVNTDDVNIWAFERYDTMLKYRYMTVIDRFGRGEGYILETLAKFLNSSYTVVMKADSYGLLIKI